MNQIGKKLSRRTRETIHQIGMALLRTPVCPVASMQNIDSDWPQQIKQALLVQGFINKQDNKMYNLAYLYLYNLPRGSTRYKP